MRRLERTITFVLPVFYFSFATPPSRQHYGQNFALLNFALLGFPVWSNPSLVVRHGGVRCDWGRALRAVA